MFSCLFSQMLHMPAEFFQAVYSLPPIHKSKTAKNKVVHQTRPCVADSQRAPQTRMIRPFILKGVDLERIWPTLSGLGSLKLEKEEKAEKKNKLIKLNKKRENTQIMENKYRNVIDRSNCGQIQQSWPILVSGTDHRCLWGFKSILLHFTHNLCNYSNYVFYLVLLLRPTLFLSFSLSLFTLTLFPPCQQVLCHFSQDVKYAFMNILLHHIE